MKRQLLQAVGRKLDRLLQQASADDLYIFRCLA